MDLVDEDYEGPFSILTSSVTNAAIPIVENRFPHPQNAHEQLTLNPEGNVKISTHSGEILETEILPKHGECGVRVVIATEEDVNPLFFSLEKIPSRNALKL
jgi:hypothetical protein